MSDEERAILFKRIGEGILEAQRRMFERKAKLGEDVIVADSEGKPIKISAAEALKQFYKRHQA